MKTLQEWLDRGRAPKKPRKRLNQVSDKKRAELAVYKVKRVAFLERNRYCEVRAGGCRNFATEVHHSERRLGGKLTDENTFVAVCRPCHHHLETHPSWARANGYLK